MRRLVQSLVIAAFTLAPLTTSAQNRRPLQRAETAVADALRQVQRSGPSCRPALQSRIEGVQRDLRALDGDADAWEVQRVQTTLSALAGNAGFANCPDAVLNALYRANEALENVRTSRWNNRRDDDRRDDDDNERSRFGELRQLQVQPNAQFEGEPAVRITVPELTLRNMRGQQFYLAARFRSLQGNWSEWTTTQTWAVPADPFVWKNAFTHYFRASTLAEEDFANGRFVARVAVFDARGREVVSREVQFRARLPQLPPGPVMPPPGFVQRDCGTGADVGCGMMRDGMLPMDGPTFLGLLQAMKSTPSEFSRREMMGRTLTNQAVTAVQFGMLLDLFNSEMTKLEIAVAGSLRLVNPQHALGYADKFNSSINKQRYVAALTSQPAIGQPPPSPTPYQPPPPAPPRPGQPGYGPGPGYDPGPGPGPGYGARDCGTGPNDPGCGMQRNGRWAMDGVTWNGVHSSLRGQSNEILRRDMLRTLVANQALTALQFGALLDLFDNEIYRMEIARIGAPLVVNPSHAIGFSNKFSNSFYARDFVTLMSQQR